MEGNVRTDVRTGTADDATHRTADGTDVPRRNANAPTVRTALWTRPLGDTGDARISDNAGSTDDVRRCTATDRTARKEKKKA